MTTQDSKKYYKSLLSTRCVCKGIKIKRKSFCLDCYRRLPKNLRHNLYKILDFGYQGAYDQAVEYLERNPI